MAFYVLCYFSHYIQFTRTLCCIFLVHTCLVCECKKRVVSLKSLYLFLETNSLAHPSYGF